MVKILKNRACMCEPGDELEELTVDGDTTSRMIQAAVKAEVSVRLQDLRLRIAKLEHQLAGKELRPSPRPGWKRLSPRPRLPRVQEPEDLDFHHPQDASNEPDRVVREPEDLDGDHPQDISDEPDDVGDEATPGLIMCLQRDTHEPSPDTVEERALKFQVHKIAENVWEAAILLNLSAVGIGGSAFLLMGILLNILLQLTFVFAVVYYFSENELPEVGDVWAWRELQGHQAANMLMESRTSLVRAICNGERTLVISNYQQTVHSMITKYMDSSLLGVPLGFMLCTMIIVQWVLMIGKEYRSTISYVSAVLNLPKNRWCTELAISKERMVLNSCSFVRRAFIFLLSVARLAIAAVLLFAGCTWQARTYDVQDLVLNAAALATVMEMDELVFASLVPLQVKTIVREIQPLKRPVYSQWQGISPTALADLLACIIVVALTITQYVIPNFETMDQIHMAICGGFKDFVFDQSALGVMVVTGTNNPSAQGGEHHRRLQPRYEHRLGSSYGPSHRRLQPWSFSRQAIWKVINNAESAEDMARLHEVLYLANQEAFLKLRVADLRTTVEFFTSQVLGVSCEDYDFAADDAAAAPHFKETMLNAFQTVSCAEMAEHCSHYGPLLRMLCPVTCGCNLPHSGLYMNGFNQGCPKKACISTPAYKQQLTSIPCMDYKVSDLAQIAGWMKFVHQWVHWWTKAQPKGAASVAQIGAGLKTHGCGLLKRIPSHFKIMLCQPTSDFGSLNPYCPVTCGCMNKSEVDCPYQCSRVLP